MASAMSQTCQPAWTSKVSMLTLAFFSGVMPPPVLDILGALSMNPSVIASEARQSMNSNGMDCRVALLLAVTNE